MRTIVLDYPVTVDGEEITQLEMRRGKARDQVTAQKGCESNAEMEIKLFANLCEVQLEVIEELDMADYGEVQKVYSGFLSRRKEKSEKE
ncbi:phage tail assembly protein [uncultured Desulfuromusa sp.]|uniref:phage tail assembly protein n=1 Tax=uncultured Desulfuromusa sp. TaxID=219183 RepID=UPI002AA88806|nr:phage tail assembly protein [uncultured Desulfuromusa sp.]